MTTLYIYIYIQDPRHMGLRKHLLPNQPSFSALKTHKGLGLAVAVAVVTLSRDGLVQLLRKHCCGIALQRRMLPKASCCVDHGSGLKFSTFSPLLSPFHSFQKSQQDACPLRFYCLTAAFLGLVLTVLRRTCLPRPTLPATPHAPVPIAHLNWPW